MEYQNFKLEIDEQGIAVFTANRPEKMNALNDLSWAEMNQFFTWADKADEVKVIIVTGAGEKAFIAGADLNSLKTKKSTDCLGGAGQKALDLIQKCSKPVIAAVNGYAFGGGCETAIACDFRVVSEDALFALPETGLGLLPGAGGTQRLARLIGLGRAQDVILLGRKIGGPEAVQIGLATKGCGKWHSRLFRKRRARQRLHFVRLLCHDSQDASAGGKGCKAEVSVHLPAAGACKAGGSIL